jgi:hypothetical protein
LGLDTDFALALTLVLTKGRALTPVFDFTVARRELAPDLPLTFT